MQNFKYLFSWIIILLMAGFSEISANYVPAQNMTTSPTCDSSSYDCDNEFGERYDKLRNRFEDLRHWSLVIDTSVQTNDELVYLVNSQDFEVALAMIKELGNDFEADSYLEVSSIPYWEKKAELFLLKIHKALTIVELELSKIREKNYEIE